MENVNSKKVVLSFINGINRHDVEALAALMSKNHLFVDSLGNSVKRTEKDDRRMERIFHLVS